MTYAEAIDSAGRAYLQGVVSAAHSMTEAARIADRNRTDFYKLCARHGIKAQRTRAKKAAKPWRFSPMGI